MADIASLGRPPLLEVMVGCVVRKSDADEGTFTVSPADGLGYRVRLEVLPFHHPLLPAGGRGCLSRREELWAMAVPLVPGPGLGNANTARKPTGALPES